MAHRLTGTNETITWTETHTTTIMVGYRDCGVCKVETPEPTTEQKTEFAKSNSGCWMWPDENNPGCMPTDWSYDSEHELICPDCTAAKNKAFKKRRKKRKR